MTTRPKSRQELQADAKWETDQDERDTCPDNGLCSWCLKQLCGSESDDEDSYRGFGVYA